MLIVLMPSRLNAPSTEERSSRASSGLGGRSSPAMKELPAEPKDQQLMVALRIRPINDTELDEGASVIAHKVGDQMVVLMDPDEDPDDALRANRSREKTFIFDIVFDQQASQEEVYCSTTQHLVEGVISGYNATVFAYGPSGAGKTYTMLGMDSEPGIYLQTLNDLFQAIEETSDDMEYTVSMSYLEIYNEVIRDLLNPSSEFLELREDSKGSIQIAGITEVSTTNAQEIMQLLIKGNKQRTQEPTAANKTSSRSHAVLQVTVKQRSRAKDLSEEVRVGKLFMVDLAGSERASQTKNRGKRMKEGAHINRSLLALGNCINALSEKGGSRSQYVNFRDSKLTRLLKDALGGNSRTVMIAHISPASTYFEESRTTLIYAYRAKNIKTRVKRNLLNVSYHIAQYTDVISDLRREIEHLKSKTETQEKEKKNGPDTRDVQEVHHDSEEDSRMQMNKIRGQLISAFKEQMEMRRSLMELENTNIELHIDTSRHLLTIADWEREKAHQAHKEKDDENVEVDGEGEEGESNEPHEVSVAREEINMLLAEQRKTAALKAGLEQRLANTKKKASQMEKLLPKQIINKDQREVLRLLCKAHELEVENTELQANNLYQKNLLCQKDFVIQRYHQHRLLCEEIIQQQRELIKGNWIPVPEPLEKRYRLYSQELEEGTLNRLLLLHSVMFNSLRDGSVLNIAQQMELHKEDTNRDQLDNRKDLPWGAKFELPPIVIEPDSEGYKSSKVTPSKKPGKRDSLLTPTSFRLLITPPVHEKPNSLSMKKMVSKLCSPTSLDLNMKKLGEDVPATSLSAEALKEIAVSTKSISLIAASRRSKTHDQEGGSSLSTMHLLDEGASEPKYWKPNLTPDLTESQRKAQTDRKQLHSSPRRGRQRHSSLERRARKKRSPSCIRNAQMGTEKLPIPMIDHPSENPSPQSHPMQHSKTTKTLFPAVPVATKTKFPTSHHTDENTLQVPEISFTFPSAIWQCNPTQNRGPVFPREVKGSADNNTSHHNIITGITRKQLGDSAKKQGRPK
ncbi:kinesin-like protein KIF19 [Trichosurus vulpecula]|uniref:kinesin-like protein KIF19 n=1 Tax=Trichosurus vulpecula TaxID=9337 RepID=UPI00186ADECF|nr:kinesin-like protein KIF19 [Trichosurus vulpecula]